MASPSILKEFLIALGFKVDDHQYKNFQNRFQAITNQFVQLGKIAAASAATASGVILKVASSMEDLYFAAQKAGTTIGNLRVLRMAAETVGLGAESITGLVQGMATAIRQNPGLHVFFKQLGIREVGDNTENFIALIAKLKELSGRGAFGHAIATQIAGAFGIDEQTLLLYEKNLPDLIAKLKESQDKLSKLGMSEQQSEQFHRFMEDVRRLETSVEQLVIAFGGQLLPYAEKLVGYMQKAVDKALEWHQKTGGRSTLIGGAVGTVGAGVGGLAISRWLLGLLGLRGGAAAAGAGAAGTGVALPLLGAAGLTAGAGLLADPQGHRFGAYNRIGQGLIDALKSIEGFSAKAYRDAKGFSIGFGHQILPGETFAGGVTREGALKLLAQDTAKAMQAVTNLVKVQLSQNQLRALTDFVFNLGAGALQRSTLLKKLNLGDFAGAAEEFQRWDKMRVNGILTKSEDLAGRRLAEKNLFESPDVNMSQQTTIHVMGGDPQQNAKAVGDEQRRVNADMLRNMQGAVR